MTSTRGHAAATRTAPEGHRSETNRGRPRAGDKQGPPRAALAAGRHRDRGAAPRGLRATREVADHAENLSGVAPDDRVSARNAAVYGTPLRSSRAPRPSPLQALSAWACAASERAAASATRRSRPRPGLCHEAVVPATVRLAVLSAEWGLGAPAPSPAVIRATAVFVAGGPGELRRVGGHLKLSLHPQHAEAGTWRIGPWPFCGSTAKGRLPAVPPRRRFPPSALALQPRQVRHNGFDAERCASRTHRARDGSTASCRRALADRLKLLERVLRMGSKPSRPPTPRETRERPAQSNQPRRGW